MSSLRTALDIFCFILAPPKIDLLEVRDEETSNVHHFKTFLKDCLLLNKNLIFRVKL